MLRWRKYMAIVRDARRGMKNFRREMLVLGGAVLLLTGCSKIELEERCFPLLVVVDYESEQKEVSFCAGFPRSDNSGGSTGQTTELQVATVMGEDFEESKERYEENLNKVADYNHLKVLVLGERLLEDKEAYDKMLEELAESEEFPRNTYVCVVSDTGALLEIDKKLPQDLGTYLEEFLNNHEEKKLLTLGDLLDEKENRILELYAPYLIPEDAYVRWEGFCGIGEKQYFFSPK